MVRSLYSGVSGLKSHQTRMDVIGNNIANVNTYGFKASRVCFSDIYYQYQRTETGGRANFAGNNPSQVGYGTQVASIDKNMAPSNLQNTGKTFDCAIAGDGFFICATLDKNRQVNGVTYTRMGDFGIDSVGNLVNVNNEFILGTVNIPRENGGEYSSSQMIDIDPNSKPTELDILNLNKLIWDAFKPECQMQFDDVPSEFARGTDQTIYECIDPYDDRRHIAYGPIYDDIADPSRTAPAQDGSDFDAMTDYNLTAPSTGVKVATDYILYSVNGKYVNAQGVEYDPKKGLYLDKKGNYYTYEAVTDKGDDGTITKTYRYQLMVDNNGTFEPANPARIYEYDKTTDTFKTEDALGNTLYADMTDSSLKFKDLAGFTIGSDGIMTASFANELRALGRIEVAVFDNPEGLKEIGDTEFAQTTASGAAVVKRPGDSGAGTVESGKLEMSNVNLADEFSDMIVTQRGYQANARIITTSDSMLEELVNLKR